MAMTEANKFKTEANEFKLLGVSWLDLPHFHERDRQHLSIRRLWWRETDYSRRPPSPEFMARLPQLLADAQREVENDKRERAADAARARELLRQARKPPCEQCLRPGRHHLSRYLGSSARAARGYGCPWLCPDEGGGKWARGDGTEHRGRGIESGAPYGPDVFPRLRDDEKSLAFPMMAPRYLRTAASIQGHACRWFGPDASRGARKMGKGDLFLGPHVIAAQSTRA
jgi:hypothetical protein